MDESPRLTGAFRFEALVLRHETLSFRPCGRTTGVRSAYDISPLDLKPAI